VKLAKYISSVGREVPQVDLIENLPVYKGTILEKRAMLDHAAAYGYQNNIIIKKREVNGIEFLSGESLVETDLDKITISYSNDIVLNYVKTEVPFGELHKLVSSGGFHYCSHGFKNGYREESHIIKGFNILILDVDHGLKMETAMDLLDQYCGLYATTKRHTKDDHRFRIILPMSHTIKLSTSDHVEFMENVFAWLPFKVDTAAKDIARKWMSYGGSYKYSAAKQCVDATQFIPRTQKEQYAKKQLLTQSSMSNLQRWFIRNMRLGNRNVMLLRYGYALMDGGQKATEALTAVHELNSAIPDPLDTREIESTIMSTLFKKENS
jgi:hypothetical protein